MAPTSRYFVLAGSNAIWAAPTAHDGAQALEYPVDSLLAQKAGAPWHIDSALPRSAAPTSGWRFLLTRSRGENILYHLQRGLPPAPHLDRVLEVRIPGDANTREYEEGHHDGASSIVFYTGLCSDRLIPERSYRLDRAGDLEALIAQGLFAKRGGLMSNRAAENYGEWLITHRQPDLLVHFEEHFNAADLASSAAWTGQTFPFQHWLSSGALSADALGHSLAIACEQGHVDLARLLVDSGTPTKEASAAVSRCLASGDRQWLDHHPGIVHLVRDADLLCEEVRNTVARGRFDKQLKRDPSLLDALGRHPHRAISLALALDSDRLLELLQSDASTMETAETKEIDCPDRFHGEDPKTHFEAGRFFLCRRILEDDALTHEQRHHCLLAAAGCGYLGLVRLLADHGVDLRYWSDHTAKCANKHGYKDLQDYLRREIGPEAAASRFP